MENKTKIKDWIKRWQRASVRYTIFFLAWFFGWMPYKIAKGITWCLMQVAYCFLRRLRRIALKSTEVAFGSTKTLKEREELIKTCFERLGQSVIEILQFISKPHILEEQVTVEGIEHLDAAFKKGKGVIGVTGHFGNFAFMNLYFARQGYKTNCIIRPQRDMELTRDLQKKIEKHGFHPVYSKPRSKCVAQSLKRLRNNELLVILIDQNFGSDGGVFVDFFGKQASTAPGPAVFARRSGAVVLPMFIVRESDERHRIIIRPPHEIVEKESESKTLQYNMQVLTSHLQEMIEKHPEDWAWMHDRWKTQPNPLLKHIYRAEN